MLEIVTIGLVIVAGVCLVFGLQARQQGNKRRGTVLIGIGVVATVGALVWLLRGMINT